MIDLFRRNFSLHHDVSGFIQRAVPAGTVPQNEDVVYVIDQAERTAFLRLTNDEERNKFIEQFWEHRNPTPGTPTNKFKEEHYRRVVYANGHFAAG
ncbi:MAG TPA: GWxTD domain-containing protein [Candidatus Sulfotelmatobacter sp.]|nr:GWxTD domain-containing protein [Candidatus Sulfotelmatobacter sp.]